MLKEKYVLLLLLAAMSLEDVDPENDISPGPPITIGNYTGNSRTFVIPHTASPGYYHLYIYFYYLIILSLHYTIMQYC
jgi:hypothetical protein